MKGYVHSVETFGSVDGPGVRFVIFLSGCNFRCQYCHNPDTWKLHGGAAYTAEELIAQAKKYRPYWGEAGGITVSGGEPLLQIEFLTELFRKAKEEGIHTVLDTSGGPFTRQGRGFEAFERLMQYTDLILLDLKQMEEEEHRRLTGHSNANSKELARYLAEKKKPVWIRHVLVPGRTDSKEHLRQLRDFLDTLPNVERVEVLPYHSMGAYKWKELGMAYPLEGVRPPGKESTEYARKILGAT